MFLNCFVHHLDVVIRIFRVWEVHTHQFDVLTVYQDRGNDGTLVDVLSVNNSFPPPFVQHNSDSVFVVVFSSSHEDVFVMCLQPAHVSTSHSVKSRPTCIPRVQLPILRFFHLSALTSCFLKNNECHFLVFWVFILFLSRTWTNIFTSLAVSFMKQCFVLPRVLLPLFFSSCFLPLLLLSSLLSSQTYRYISINGAMLESSSSFSSQVFHSFCFVIIVISAVSRVCW